MSKVEELQDEVVTYCDPWQRDSAVRVLDSLIAAAHAYLWWKKEVAG